MIHTARWKYFFYPGEEYLYDLLADPGEETNLITAPENRALADELKARATAGWTNPTRTVRDITGDAQAAKKKKRAKQ